MIVTLRTWLIAFTMVAVPPGSAMAQVLTCVPSQAWRLGAGGLDPHPFGATGHEGVALLVADTTKRTLSMSSGQITDAVMRSTFDAATGADVVFSTPDASLVFRARRFDDGIAYTLSDTYDFYVGSCRE